MNLVERLFGLQITAIPDHRAPALAIINRTITPRTIVMFSHFCPLARAKFRSLALSSSEERRSSTGKTPANVATSAPKANSPPKNMESPQCVEMKIPVFKPEVRSAIETPATILDMLVTTRRLFILETYSEEKLPALPPFMEGSCTMPRKNMVPIQATPPRKWTPRRISNRYERASGNLSCSEIHTDQLYLFRKTLDVVDAMFPRSFLES